MRDKFWYWLLAKQLEGSILPFWMLTIKAILYPLEFFYWKMSKAQGYRLETDTWKIEGIHFSGSSLRALANAQGEIYQITRSGNCVILKQLKEETK